MRENLIKRRGRYDDIILDFLREKERSKKEVISLSIRGSPKYIPYSTLHRRLKQLEKYGYIQHLDVYKLVRVEEADPEEVQQCIQVIKKEENENVLLGRINQLRQISAGKRVAHLPGVISCLRTLLAKSRVAINPQIYRETVLTLEQIMNFEMRTKSPDSKRIIEKIVDSTLNEVISIIDEKPEFPDGAVIRYLGKTEREEAVRILFKKIKSAPLHAKQQINDLGVALGKHCLYKKYQKLINELLDDLLRSDDEATSAFGKELKHQILWVF